MVSTKMYGVEYFNFIQRLKLQGGHSVCRAIYSDNTLFCRFSLLQLNPGHFNMKRS